MRIHTDKQKALNGAITSVCAAALTFLFFVQVQVVWKPIPLNFRLAGDLAYGYASSLSTLCDSLAAYWKFDENGGSLILDTSQNAHTANISNNQWSSDTPLALDDFANPYSIDLSSNNPIGNVTYQSFVENEIEMLISGDLSIAGWVQYESLDTDSDDLVNPIVAMGDSSGINYYFNIMKDKKLRLAWTYNSGSVESVVSSVAASLSADTWVHLGVTRDTTNKEVIFFVNGVQLGTTQAYTNNCDHTNATTLDIGNDPVENNNNFEGKMDDLRVYSKELTIAEMGVLAGLTDDSFAGCTCGNGVIESPEKCDDGSSNSDSLDNACRTTCQNAYCGDGVLDTGEECDEGDDNGDIAGATCRTTCKLPYCGDAVKDAGEQCDDGNNVSTDSCTVLCKNAACGDGFIQSSAGENCEPPGSAGCASNCIASTGGGGSNKRRTNRRRTTTTVSSAAKSVKRVKVVPPPAGCGNRIWEPHLGEECDEGDNNGKGTCSRLCKILYCGDGVVSPELYEECEPTPVGIANGLPLYDQPTCGTEPSCSAPRIDERTKSIHGGCTRVYLPLCNTESGDAPENCGNGRIDDEEECDGGTGCSAQCQKLYCGDGVVQTAGADGETGNADDEDCDNGSVCSNDSGKSCRSRDDCGVQLECLFAEDVNGFRCGGESSGNACTSDFDCATFGECVFNTDVDPSCPATCQRGICGNSVLEAGESCDDGNADGGDGCSATCSIEESVPICGNGILEDGEECDDGNTDDGDGCSSTCESNLKEAASEEESEGDSLLDSLLQSSSEPLCGNGKREDGELCDDGTANSDSTPGACRTDCTLPYCGDGIADPSEQCDLGTQNSDTQRDSCRTDCRFPYCGDGVRDSDEECDSGPDCTSTCVQMVNAVCGNSEVESGEQCDDGNTVSGDGCSPWCQEELVSSVPEPLCGDGSIDDGEECDDGNTVSGDGCSDSCKNEVLAAQTKGEPSSSPQSSILNTWIPQKVTEIIKPPVKPPVHIPEPRFVPPPQPIVAPVSHFAAQLPTFYVPLPDQTRGETGPGAIVVIVSGCAAGASIVRRRKREQKTE